MTKDNFSHIFQIAETLNNKVQIENSDGNLKLMFYFGKNILERINCNLYLD